MQQVNNPKKPMMFYYMVVAIVKNAYKNAEELLSANMDKLHKIAKYLYEQETITGEEFMKLLEEKEES